MNITLPSTKPKETAIGGVVSAYLDANNEDYSIPKGTFSTSWKIMDAQLKCDILTIDSGLENSYAEYLLQGKHIPIPMQVFISQSQTLSQSDQESVNITRSLTRLQALYITFLGTKDADLQLVMALPEIYLPRPHPMVL